MQTQRDLLPIPRLSVFETIGISFIVFAVGVLAILLLLLGIAGAQPLPESVLAYERVKSLMPVMQVDGVPLQGLSLCKLKARCDAGEKQPFLAMPSDMHSPREVRWCLGNDCIPHVWGEPCDVSHTLLAYGGWCRAGIEHPTNPHLAPSMLPLVTCEQHGDTTVIYLNNITKIHWKPTPEGQAKAVEWLSQPRADTKPWGTPGIELLPRQWLNDLPPKP